MRAGRVKNERTSTGFGPWQERPRSHLFDPLRQRQKAMTMPETLTTVTPTATHPRRITHSTRGRSHGPLVRLVSPSDVGELIKPFVFLDYFEADPAHVPAFGFHPHSGIATLTLLLSGQLWYEETTGAKGLIAPGGIEWMRAGGGVWHTGGAAGPASINGEQLWV